MVNLKEKEDKEENESKEEGGRGKGPSVRNMIGEEKKEEKRMGRKKLRKGRRNGGRGHRGGEWFMGDLEEEDKGEK